MLCTHVRRNVFHTQYVKICSFNIQVENDTKYKSHVMKNTRSYDDMFKNFNEVSDDDILTVVETVERSRFSFKVMLFHTY